MRCLFFLLVLVVGVVAAGHPPYPSKVNSFPLKQASVSSFTTSFPGSSAAVMFTTFGVIGNDFVYVVKDAAALLKNATPELVPLNTKARWPNQADMAPLGSTPSPSVLTSGGFFAGLGKSTGIVNLIDVSKFPEVTIQEVSTDDSGYFYHHCEWLDVDGDSLQDIVCARVNKPVIGSAKGELTWIKQPSDVTGAWEENVLTDGPDVGFAIHDLDGDGTMEIIATQFFTAKQLAVYSCAHPLWSDCEGGKDVTIQVIDSGKAAYFNLEFADLNGDKKTDILVTTNAADGSGAVYAFEIPDKYSNATFPKHVLATGYKPLQSWQPGAGAPGTAQSFQLDSNNPARPLILVSADDGGYVDLLSAASEDPTDWSYDRVKVVPSTGTVGTPAVGDFDGNGIADFVVPKYSESTVEVYTFTPPNKAY